MLIQVAGTSGSGKSHLMRSFLKHMRKEAEVEEGHLQGRASPIGYLINRKNNPIFVAGAYDVPTGGCDTIRDVKQVYELLDKHLKLGRHVVFEGLFCMNQTRGPQLATRLGKDYVVLQLATPLATCLASINSRRAERGEGELANQTNTIDNYRRATNFCASMREAGARVIRVTRDEGLDKMLELLE